jgi:nucleoside-diphosphate-sugar epimerase
MMSKSSTCIAVLGGNGVYARQLIPRLLAAGYRVRALVRRIEAAAFAATSGAEIRWSELFAFVAASVNAAPPAPGGRLGFPSFRVRNARARAALGWKPFYSDFRAGLAR